MKTREEYIEILANHAQEIKTEYGVNSLCIFGSVARNEQQPDSDLFVDVKPTLRILIKLKQYLEQILESPVDLIRKHNNLNSFIKREIERDGITIF